MPKPDAYKSEGHNWIPQEVYLKIKNRTNNCEGCGKWLTWNKKELHHKIPISRGGTDDPKNIMIVCRDCHRKLDKELNLKVWRNNK